jgi:hypothetical protein
MLHFYSGARSWNIDTTLDDAAQQRLAPSARRLQSSKRIVKYLTFQRCGSRRAAAACPFLFCSSRSLALVRH